MDQQTFFRRIKTVGRSPVETSLPELPLRSKLTTPELAFRLTQELEAVGGVVHRADSSDEARVHITKLLRGLQARHIVRTRAPILEELDLDRALFEAGIESVVCDLKVASGETIRDAAFSAHAGITGVDYGVAETGTLALLTRPAEGRAVSLVPPVHIGVLRVRDIVFELGELFERAVARDRGLPSALTFVTGPSSTADIELVHTVGVHGPRELHLVLVD
jgi:L-lactate dehydrogenase complex protein LldG